MKGLTNLRFFSSLYSYCTPDDCLRLLPMESITKAGEVVVRGLRKSGSSASVRSADTRSAEDSSSCVDCAEPAAPLCDDARLPYLGK